MKDFASVLFLLGSVTALAPANSLAAPCGPVTRSSQVLPAQTQLWQFGTDLIYEYGGGLSLSGSTAVPEMGFRGTADKIKAVFEIAGSRFLILTSERKGMGVYTWDSSRAGSSRLSWVQSRELRFNENGMEIAGPLVDAYLDGSRIFLLTNFHLMSISRDDLLSGLFSPSKSRFPDCPILSPDCLRGAGLFAVNRLLAPLQMHPSLSASVHVRSSLHLDQASMTWTPVSTVADLSRYQYIQLFRSRRIPFQGAGRVLAGSSGVLDPDHQLLGSDPGSRISKLAGYVTDATFMDDQNLAQSEGIVTYRDQSVYFMKSGTPVCQAFSQARSAVFVFENGTYRISGIDGSRRKLTVTLRSN